MYTTAHVKQFLKGFVGNLEADKRRATRIISKKKVHEIVEQELNKPEIYKKIRTDTIKKSRTAINKKLVELKVKDLITKEKHSSLKPSVPKTPKPDQY